MPIQILSPQLANQIAAGEVVERPASVIKELIENSLDAGATQIDIDIERGGIKRIQIRDNGCGIVKDELVLALARHATSKIATLDDLEAITSLGFRGEALASISSVSRLTLTSRPATQNEAWQAYAEGRDMEVVVKPAAHPVGTTIEVLDLFYNTPARRKFLRTEKTEFNHIDEVLRRIALTRFDVAINIHHNDKLIRQYKAIKESQPKERRLAAVCGTQFTANALSVSWLHGDLKIEGWVAKPTAIAQFSELQYIYVNGRVMRDRLLNHAIRQAYQHQILNDQQPAYVLYLTVDPHQVDVNVHPAKQEVRFHQSRLVHDFVYQAIATVLQHHQLELNTFSAEQVLPTKMPENRAAAGLNQFTQATGSIDSVRMGRFADKRSNNNQLSNDQLNKSQLNKNSIHNQQKQIQEQKLYGNLLSTSDSLSGSNVVRKDLSEYNIDNPPIHHAKEDTALFVPSLFPQPTVPVSQKLASIASTNDNRGLGKVLAIWQLNHALVEYNSGLAIISLNNLVSTIQQYQLTPKNNALKSQPLLIPLVLNLSKEEFIACKRHNDLLSYLGISTYLERGKMEVRAVPLPLRQQNLQQILPVLLSYLSKNDEVNIEQLIFWLAKKMTKPSLDGSLAQVIQMISELEQLKPDIFSKPPENLLQLIELKEQLAILQNE